MVVEFTFVVQVSFVNLQTPLPQTSFRKHMIRVFFPQPSGPQKHMCGQLSLRDRAKSLLFSGLLKVSSVNSLGRYLSTHNREKSILCANFYFEKYNLGASGGFFGFFQLKVCQNLNSQKESLNSYSNEIQKLEFRITAQGPDAWNFLVPGFWTALEF